MARKQATGPGSHRVKSFLLGFRWLALFLGIILVSVDSGSRLAPNVAPFGIAIVIFVFVVYHIIASILATKLLDQTMVLYVLVAFDAATGALLTWLYGLDFFLLATGLPVLETAYLGGITAAIFVAFLIGLLNGVIVFEQMISLQRMAERLTDLSVTEVHRVRLMDLAQFVLIELLLIWVMNTVRAEEEMANTLRRKQNEEMNVVLEELSNTRKDCMEAFNELSTRDATINRLKSEMAENGEELEKSLRKLHEVQSTLHAAQQKMQQREQQLTTAHRREVEEFKKELEDFQRTLDRSTALLEGFLSVNASLHRDQTVMNIIEIIMKLVPSQTCLLYTLEIQEGQQELYPDGGASPYLEFLRNYNIKPGEGAVGWVAKRREPIRIDKEVVTIEGEELSTLVTHEKSAIVVPLEGGGRMLGVVYLGRAQPSSFSQEDFDTAVQFARVASTTFNNALMYQRTLSVGIFDDVTNVYNALYFDERLTEEVKRARRYQFPLSLILIDIDNFVRYNEAFGQAAGNVLMKDVADILRENTRETDVLARLENDEFAVLLVESAKANAIVIGERIRMALEVRYLGKTATRQTVRITVSGGVACLPEEADSRESLVEKAAAALMQARRKGGNQIQHA